MTVKFTIPGPPHGKERPRLTKTGHAYTPEKTVEYEQKVRDALLASGNLPPRMLAGPLQMDIVAYYPIPESASRTRREKMLNGTIRPTVKPDNSNVSKIVEDAIQVHPIWTTKPRRKVLLDSLEHGILYHDDSYIVEGPFTRKFYSDNPRVEVAVCELGTEGIGNA
jgi:Holliday junction resolvase RusA-like endonuclease